jgi:hypothetical protein
MKKKNHLLDIFSCQLIKTFEHDDFFHHKRTDFQDKSFFKRQITCSTNNCRAMNEVVHQFFLVSTLSS